MLRILHEARRLGKRNREFTEKISNVIEAMPPKTREAYDSLMKTLTDEDASYEARVNAFNEAEEMLKPYGISLSNA